jgi:hypothetical protein
MGAVAEIKQTFSLAPQTLDEAMKYSKMIAESEFVPKNFQNKPGNVLIAIQMGEEVGLKPLQSLQSIAVINGKPGLYGDAGKAILLAAGCIIEEDDLALIKTNGFARCKITRPNRPPVERTFSIDNAKTAGLYGKEGPWRTYPERQMSWRAFWFAARDAASDLLKGIKGLEELLDYQPEKDITGQAEQTATKTAEPEYLDQETFDEVARKYSDSVANGKKTPSDFIAWVEGKGKPLTAEQKTTVNGWAPQVIEGESSVVDDPFVAEMNAEENK